MGCGREGSVAMRQSDCAALYGVEWLRQVGESSDEVDVYRGMFTYFVICVELHVVELATDVLEIGGVAGCLRSSNISSGYVYAFPGKGCAIDREGIALVSSILCVSR